MSIGRNHPINGPGTRDERGDYIEALEAEYKSYVNACGLAEKAEQVAAVLRAYGHEVGPEKPEAGQKERAVGQEPLERAVDGDAVKRRPGRPKKATGSADSESKA